MRRLQGFVLGVSWLVALCAVAGQPTVGAAARGLDSEKPVITAVLPQAPSRNSTAQILTVNGANFGVGLTLEVQTPAGSSMTFSGKEIQSARDSSFQVSIILAVAGNYTFVVRNTDGGVSDPFVVKVQPASGAPAIEKVSPESPTRKTEPQTLIVSGRNFAQGLSLSVTDPTGQVAVIKGNAIGTITPTSFEVSLVLDKSGDYSLLVTNPSGESSNALTVVVALQRQ